MREWLMPEVRTSSSPFKARLGGGWGGMGTQARSVAPIPTLPLPLKALVSQR